MLSRHDSSDDSEAIGGAEVPREMNKYGNVLTGKLPWWMSIIVVIGLGEIAWFAQTVIYGTKQSAVTTTEIHQLQSGQAALTASRHGAALGRQLRGDSGLLGARVQGER